MYKHHVLVGVTYVQQNCDNLKFEQVHCISLTVSSIGCLN
jgi:hypothetical protein